MGIIHHLDNITINKIAAGEVVERPASVVKELVENSIDAGASAVTIEIENGGISLIRITDNGSGMGIEDAALCFDRHATSKISNSSDLEGIISLGFRGEALASISAVSQVQLTTRLSSAFSGFMISVNGGELGESIETGCPEGTTIMVSNLFYNTPARLKFLKSPRSETAAISDLILRLIMAHPEISFKYISQGRVVYHSPGNGDLLFSILSVYGRDIRDDLLKVEAGQRDGISIYGYIGRPSLSRSNRSHQTFFVNGRYIRSTLLSQCLEEAYQTRVMVNQFPWAVVHMSISPGDIDVNVHPSKTEIRFKDEDTVRGLFKEWMRNALMDNRQNESMAVQPSITIKTETDTQQVSMDNGNISSINALNHDNHIAEGTNNASGIINMNCDTGSHISNINIDDSIDENKYQMPARNIYISKDDSLKGDELSNNGINSDDNDNNIDDSAVIPTNPCGYLFSTYIMAEDKDKVYVIDQHAAHERIVYEQLMKSIERQQISSQQLLEPVVLELTHSESIIISENIELFKSIGFEIEPFGSRSYLIRGVPVALKDISITELFNRILDGTENRANTSMASLQRNDIIRMACRQAVKAHDKLSNVEITALIRDLNSLRGPLTCPHGRPILITISRYELEKRFNRV